MGRENAKAARDEPPRLHAKRPMGFATAVLAIERSARSLLGSRRRRSIRARRDREKWPKGEYFILDVQTHFHQRLRIWVWNGEPAPVVGFVSIEFLKNMGFNLKGDAEAYSFHNFVKRNLLR